MKNLVLITFIFCSFSCANTKNTNSTQKSTSTNSMDYVELTRQKFSLSSNTDTLEYILECIENEDKTLILCKKTTQGTVMQPRNFIEFVIYDTQTTKIVYQSSASGGSVEWYDKNRLAIYQQQGNPMQGKTRADMTIIYDVLEKTQKRKSEIEK